MPQLAAALDGVLYHHEHWDGSGYPDGLAGEDIPLQARLIQVGDVFDALTSNRPYRQPFTWEKALSILEEEAGRTIDPELQKKFDQMIRERVQQHDRAWEEMIIEAEAFNPALDTAYAAPLEEA
jgi:putative two-component system response regulator